MTFDHQPANQPCLFAGLAAEPPAPSPVKSARSRNRAAAWQSGLARTASYLMGQCRSEDDVLAIARDADALMVQWAPITRRVMEQLARCRIISRYGVGVDMIDLQAARDHRRRANMQFDALNITPALTRCPWNWWSR